MDLEYAKLTAFLSRSTAFKEQFSLLKNKQRAMFSIFDLKQLNQALQLSEFMLIIVLQSSLVFDDYAKNDTGNMTVKHTNLPVVACKIGNQYIKNIIELTSNLKAGVTAGITDSMLCVLLWIDFVASRADIFQRLLQLDAASLEKVQASLLLRVTGDLF